MFGVQIPHEETVGLLFPRGFTALPKNRNNTGTLAGVGRCVDTSELGLPLGVWVSMMPEFPRAQRAFRMCPCSARVTGTPRTAHLQCQGVTGTPRAHLLRTSMLSWYSRSYRQILRSMLGLGTQMGTSTETPMALKLSWQGSNGRALVLSVSDSH